MILAIFTNAIRRQRGATKITNERSERFDLHAIPSVDTVGELLGALDGKEDIG
jgi:hypothetical protein